MSSTSASLLLGDLTSEELASLQFGLPEVAIISEALLVPFEVFEELGATIAWINEGWFLGRGLDVTKPTVRARVDAWILANFAFSTTKGDVPLEDARTKVFFADRYGGAGAAAHGGSGRCGIINCFQVKGVGATPLVGSTDDWGHSHGCLWLEEAVREAILAEIAFAEFPEKAIQSLAVIDLGRRYVLPDGSLGEWQALLLRPSFLRPAHLERAMLPGRLKSAVLSDALDYRRVRDVTQHFVADLPTNDAVPQIPKCMSNLLNRLAQQMAYGQVHRLFNGGYFSANITMDGQLVDFGSFRSVPFWAKVTTSDGAPASGDEWLALREVARSLMFSIDKHVPQWDGHLPPIATVAQSLDSWLVDAFRHQSLRLFGLTLYSDRQASRSIAEALRYYYELQQRVHVSHRTRIHDDGKAWLLQDLIQFDPGERLTPGAATIGAIDDALISLDSDERAGGLLRQRAWLTACRMLLPRTEIYREELQEAIWENLTSCAEQSERKSVIAAMISTVVAHSRRDWSLLPERFVVWAQDTQLHSSTLLISENGIAKKQLWLQGINMDGGILHYGILISKEDLHGFSVATHNGVSGFAVDLPSGPHSHTVTARIGTAKLDLRLPVVAYGAPDWVLALLPPNNASSGVSYAGKEALAS